MSTGVETAPQSPAIPHYTTNTTVPVSERKILVPTKKVERKKKMSNQIQQLQYLEQVLLHLVFFFKVLYSVFSPLSDCSECSRTGLFFCTGKNIFLFNGSIFLNILKWTPNPAASVFETGTALISFCFLSVLKTYIFYRQNIHCSYKIRNIYCPIKTIETLWV